ncbi:alpha/beta hydrolase family protein [Aquidulcibacter paucihalophilus]|uniref:alpha/beta hydrolase family protein n=1 Tax=Aquidulcibacter paucihalophilus TaxID=1978549 RepID=UPI0012FF74D1|nr:prolyl oligopeptidase family serine peptidase [Aquidulcibacter paucihalophilus]
MFAKRLALLVSTAICVAAAATSTVQAQNFKPTGPALPVDVMSRDWGVWSARISPDGKHIAALAGIPGQNPVIRVWSTDDMSKTPTQFGSKTMRFTGFQFMNNSKLLVFANQPVAAGANSDWYSRAAIANLDGSSFLDISNEEAATTRDDDFIIGYSLFNRLPKEENVVLMEIQRISGSEIVRLNLNTGRKDRFARTGDNEEFLWSDSDGNIKLKGELKAANGVYTYHFFFRENNQAPWRELTGIRYNLNARFDLRPVHISNDNKSIYVITNRDSNFSVLAKYDLETNTLGPPIVQNTEFDISSASFGTASDEDALTQDPLRSFCWAGPSTECNYLDPIDTRIHALLERALPDTIISFNSRNGGANVLVRATAPNVPDTYYLLKNERQLIKIGSLLEGWDRKNLGPAEWVTYPARDGFQIPGILYLPPGYKKERDGRLPLVVMPHGGPWARDDMDFDISYWSQMFATRGFAVLLPQYRGSTDLGKALWKGGDKQWGALMQDDKDDGAKWLVDQGIADPNRMMMYGYSYGGFAAAAAATRSGGRSAGLWQCAISGAPAIDLERISNDWGENRLARTLQGVTVAGFDPMDHLDQVKIPWLIFHGDYDRQADTIHSRTTAARMRQVNPNANFRYVEIPRMAHTLGEMTPQHRTQFLSLILEWMSTNCGNISQTFKEPGLKTTLTKRASK